MKTGPMIALCLVLAVPAGPGLAGGVSPRSDAQVTIVEDEVPDVTRDFLLAMLVFLALLAAAA